MFKKAKIKVFPAHAKKAYRKDRGTAALFLKLGTRGK